MRIDYGNYTRCIADSDISLAIFHEANRQLEQGNIPLDRVDITVDGVELNERVVEWLEPSTYHLLLSLHCTHVIAA